MWGRIEADFQREYGIDLPRGLARMSWRRFTALIAGLSPESALARGQARTEPREDSAAGLLRPAGGMESRARRPDEAG